VADDVAEFKRRQKEVWAQGNFGEIAVFTTVVSGHLARFAGVRSGQALLDVGCGTGPLAITAALKGATVTGLDLTPELLAQARASAPIAGVAVDWREGDVEALPFGDASFDVVLSQFGHMFAPRPEVAVREMLRVLKPGGRIAFATWPPETFIGRSFLLAARYVPPPPGAQSPPVRWGEFATIRERLGDAVRDLLTERGTMTIPTLSPAHYMAWHGARSGQFLRTMGVLQKEPARRDEYMREYSALIREYLDDNLLKQEYVLTRAIKT